jgi:hypothetical protein
MWKAPGARPQRFEAVEKFAVGHVAFSWRATFPLAGPLALRVADGFDGTHGHLRVSLLGIPLQTQTGPETDIGEAMRYLAELPWAPQAVATNRDLTWREVDESSVDVECSVGDATARVRWAFDANGDPVHVTGLRPRPVGRTFVATRWGGEFSDYTEASSARIPRHGHAWWELPEGRFVYWRAGVRL